MTRLDMIVEIIDRYYPKCSHVYNLLTAKEIDEIFMNELSGKEDADDKLEKN